MKFQCWKYRLNNSEKSCPICACVRVWFNVSIHASKLSTYRLQHHLREIAREGCSYVVVYRTVLYLIICMHARLIKSIMCVCVELIMKLYLDVWVYVCVYFYIYNSWYDCEKWKVRTSLKRIMELYVSVWLEAMIGRPSGVMCELQNLIWCMCCLIYYLEIIIIIMIAVEPQMVFTCVDVLYC